MKILYFTSDFSEQNIEFAKKYGMTMRNVVVVETAQNLEQCDFVYGDETPESYRAKYPAFTLPSESSEEVTQLKARIAELEAELAEAKNTKPDKSKKTTPPPIAETE